MKAYTYVLCHKIKNKHHIKIITNSYDHAVWRKGTFLTHSRSRPEKWQIFNIKSKSLHNELWKGCPFGDILS